MALKDKFIVRLTADQRGQLEQAGRSGRHSARTLLHARILLKAGADGLAWQEARVAEALECGDRTVARVRKKFATGGSTPPCTATSRRGGSTASSMAARKPSWSPWPAARPRTASAAGRCGCWPTGW